MPSIKSCITLLFVKKGFREKLYISSFFVQGTSKISSVLNRLPFFFVYYYFLKIAVFCFKPTSCMFLLSYSFFFLILRPFQFIWVLIWRNTQFFSCVNKCDIFCSKENYAVTVRRLWDCTLKLKTKKNQQYEQLFCETSIWIRNALSTHEYLKNYWRCIQVRPISTKKAQYHAFRRWSLNIKLSLKN